MNIISLIFLIIVSPLLGKYNFLNIFSPLFISFFFLNFYCYSITVVCLFSHPSTPPHVHLFLVCSIFWESSHHYLANCLEFFIAALQLLICKRYSLFLTSLFMHFYSWMLYLSENISFSIFTLFSCMLHTLFVSWVLFSPFVFISKFYLRGFDQMHKSRHFDQMMFGCPCILWR